MRTASKKVIGIMLVCLALTGTVHAQERLTFSLAGGTPEFYKLFSSHLLREVSQKIGFPCEFKEFPAERAMVSANRGNVDGALLRMAGNEKTYSNLVRVSVPIMYYDIMAYTKDMDIEIAGWESLRPYTISILRGNKLAEQRTAGMLVEPVATVEQSLKKLMADRVDVAVESRESECLAKSLGFSEIRLLEPPLESLPLYCYLHNRHSSLIPRLEEILIQMEESGDIARIFDEAMEQFLSKCEK